MTPAQINRKLTSFSWVRASPMIAPQTMERDGLTYWQMPVVISGR